jgi:2,3-bisphosphoglycerate-independent phosphoglycerate mutase
MLKKKVILIIRDGWGHGEHNKGNAIFHANTPNHDNYKKNYPTAIIKCTGNDVGNPDGVQGGSEVGHLTMGAGRIVWQPYELINQKIKTKEFFNNTILLEAIEHCKKNNSNLHISGLCSTEGVHADYKHMLALLDLAKNNNFNRVYLHLCLDGRDMPEKSALPLIKDIEKKISELNVGKIASVFGRFYGMDRDMNWDRTKKAYDVMVDGIGFKAKNAEQALNDAYNRGDKTDYYVQPSVIVDLEDKPIATIKENDSFIWCNFRSDRAKQITSMLCRLDYCTELPEKNININYVCFSSYDSNWDLPVAFPQEKITHNLGQVISDNHLKQLRISETEKYAHVTFFFNSQNDTPYNNEERIMVPSPKVSSYDQKPEMSAYELTEKILPEIGKYDFILINFPNPDLVGHSGVFDAVVKACEVVDECSGKVIKKAIENDYDVILMGDHGNADHMYYDNDEPDPSHGMNPVLMTLISNDEEIKFLKLKDGGMKDIAPTILKLLGLTKPVEMTGESLF